MLTKSIRAVGAAIVLAFSGTACSTVYYDTLENFGIEKRDVLVDRVKDTKRAQTDAQQEFRSALEEFRFLVEVEGGSLEKKYDKMSKAYEGADKEANAVRDRVASVKRVGKALFKEWEGELGQYQDASLKARSQAQYQATKSEFTQLTAAMDRATAKMDPVLSVFNDQVLFLKHNLNARAISSLDLEKTKIEERVEALIVEMELAIQEADAFIESMR